MKLRSAIIFAIIVSLSLTAVPAAFAEQAEISPFVQYEEGNVYRLGRYDVFNVVIIGYPDPEMFSEIQVGIDGYVDMPFIGTVKLSGLTIEEARVMLTEKLGEYLKDPSLSVMVVTYGARQVYVMGEVNKQGVYMLPATSMNIFSAITSAGGITRRGRPKHITLVRVVGDQLITREINLDRLIKKHDIEQNIELLDGDMIYVPRSNKIIINEDILPIVSLYGLYKTVIDD